MPIIVLFFLTKLDIYNDTFVEISNKNVLNILNITNKQLLDFCIMCGTDYNNNIPKIGPENAFKYISKYINIEEIEKNLKIDVTILNHICVRELFTVFDKYEIINIKYCSSPNFDDLIKFTQTNLLKIDIDKIKKDFTVELIFEDD